MKIEDRYSLGEKYLTETVQYDPAHLQNSEKRTLDTRSQSDIIVAFDRAMAKSYFKYSEGYVMVFDSKIYRKTDPKVLESVMMSVLENKEFPNLYVTETPKKIVAHCTTKLLRTPFVPDKGLIAFENCVLNLDTGDTMPHSPDLATTIYLDFEYNKKAKCPLWMEFLHYVVPNENKVIMLQEFLGAVFVDRRKYKIEQMMYLIGSGQNGKGVFTGTIRGIFGVAEDDGLTSALSAEDLFKSGKREYNMATVNGKLINICDDMSNVDTSGGDMKKFISGEPAHAREPYGRPFTATQIPLMVASLNEFPKTAADRSDGNYRRPWIVRFDVRIPNSKVDTQLPAKLLEEKSGILNWILEGRRRFIANGGKLTPSAENDAEIADLKIKQDSRLQWLRDANYQSKESPGAERIRKSLTELYAEYKQFAQDNGVPPFGKQALGMLLAQEGYESMHRRDGTAYWLFVGGEGAFNYDQEDMNAEELAASSLPF